ncbi:MerR family transcriptional regulator [Saccharothrix violaceirubra]|uniref:DNA-binding transcriptional MerR regulator n=1 Tax=Saccharothrix violaceirubra TaxID=413306 RepID=A0A7W7T5Q7_9PSEU|nr:MerR family transcriptional regulator [Saccharothrix violaceirubra]MBB4967078.1 DNA-binding transcriptional MerR regulator [Saccharothrix violaceirubra]
MLWNPGAVARMLDVSPTTLRTWDRRYGLGPSTRSAGNHRRYSADDVARLRRMIALTRDGVSPAVAAAAVKEVLSAPEFAEAASRLDVPLMTSTAARLIAERGVVAAWEDVLAPFLAALGERIAEQGAGVEIEHLASGAILAALATRPEVTGRPCALLACAPDEQHSLPLHALAAALTELGHATRNLGARVPARALLDTVNLLTPPVIVLWAHDRTRAEAVPLPDLLRSGHRVLLGGAGWAMEPTGTRKPASLNEAVTTIVELNRF